MKIKEDLMLREICGAWMVVPMGERLMEFHGMIRLNETGAFIWEKMESGMELPEIADAIVEEYEITKEKAIEKIEEFMEMLKKEGLVEQE